MVHKVLCQYPQWQKTFALECCHWSLETAQISSGPSTGRWLSWIIKLRPALHGVRFSCMPQNNSESNFQMAFVNEHWQYCWKECMDHWGDYFEKALWFQHFGPGGFVRNQSLKTFPCNTAQVFCFLCVFPCHLVSFCTHSASSIGHLFTPTVKDAPTWWPMS